MLIMNTFKQYNNSSKDHIRIKYNKKKKMNLTRLSICNYFIELRTEIDVLFAKKSLINNNYNQKWLHLIEITNDFEFKCLNNISLFSNKTILFVNNLEKLIFIQDGCLSFKTIEYLKKK